MLIGGVIRHKIQDQLEANLVALIDQFAEVLKRPELFMNITKVRNVIAMVSHWRFVDRRKPNAINSKVFNVLQLRFDALQVTHTVAVNFMQFIISKRLEAYFQNSPIAIFERSRVDLIEISAIVPLSLTQCDETQQQLETIQKRHFPIDKVCDATEG